MGRQCGPACSTHPQRPTLILVSRGYITLLPPRCVWCLKPVSSLTLAISAQPCPSPTAPESRPASRHVPFCTLSHSRKISSPPRQLPEFRFTRQILSSAVLGAPEGVGTREEALNYQRSPGLACRRSGTPIHRTVKAVQGLLTAPPQPTFIHFHWLLTPANSAPIYLLDLLCA